MNKIIKNQWKTTHQQTLKKQSTKNQRTINNKSNTINNETTKKREDKSTNIQIIIKETSTNANSKSRQINEQPTNQGNLNTISAKNRKKKSTQNQQRMKKPLIKSIKNNNHSANINKQPRTSHQQINKKSRTHQHNINKKNKTQSTKKQWFPVWAPLPKKWALLMSSESPPERRETVNVPF